MRQKILIMGNIFWSPSCRSWRSLIQLLPLVWKKSSICNHNLFQSFQQGKRLMVPWWNNTVAYFRSHHTWGQLFWALTATLRTFSMHIRLMWQCQAPQCVPTAIAWSDLQSHLQQWQECSICCAYRTARSHSSWGKVPSGPVRWWVEDKVVEQLNKLKVLVRILKPLENCKANMFRQ